MLVVEDDREIRELLRRYLERAGYAVLTTGSGAEAIQMLSGRQVTTATDRPGSARSAGGWRATFVLVALSSVVVLLGQGGVTWPVLVDGQTVGSVRLGFETPASSPGRGVAWSWILLAAAAAILVAILASWFVTHRLSGPITRLAAAARALAAGDRSARSGVVAAGELGNWPAPSTGWLTTSTTPSRPGD